MTPEQFFERLKQLSSDSNNLLEDVIAQHPDPDVPWIVAATFLAAINQLLETQVECGPPRDD
jgi:hypothetical protein